jgi:hypothetical protein
MDWASSIHEKFIQKFGRKAVERAQIQESSGLITARLPELLLASAKHTVSYYYATTEEPWFDSRVHPV